LRGAIYYYFANSVTKLPPSREATSVIRPHFHCRRGGLYEGDYCNIIRISIFFFFCNSSFHRSYFFSSCSTIFIHKAPILKCKITPWNCVKLEKQKKI
jgi:hypothetical protein